MIESLNFVSEAWWRWMSEISVHWILVGIVWMLETLTREADLAAAAVGAVARGLVQTASAADSGVSRKCDGTALFGCVGAP